MLSSVGKSAGERRRTRHPARSTGRSDAASTILGGGSATDQNDVERRTHTRHTLAIPAYLQLSSETPVVPVRTTNLSHGGFVCLTSAALGVGTMLHVRLQLTPHEALDCMAQVVRVDDPLNPLPPGHWARVALRFVDLDEAKDRQIADALAVLGPDVDQTDVPTAYRSGPATLVK